MRKVSKSRVDDDLVSSTNGSLNEEPADDAAADKLDDDSKDDEERHDRDDANGSYGDDDEPLESSASKTTPKKTKKPKAKKGRKKKAAKSNKNDDSNEEEEEEEEYEVEKVVGSKKMKGKLHYLIRWKGYSASSDTWEPEDTLSCPELIKKFKDEQESGKEEKPSKKGKKRKVGKTKETKPAKRPKTDWDSENADENAEYEVERIMEVHHKKNGDREFLIHWKGWSSKFDSWEPEEHLNCSDMIKKFMDKVEKAKTSDGRSLRVNPESTNRFTLQAQAAGRRLSKRRGQRQRVRYDNAE